MLETAQQHRIAKGNTENRRKLIVLPFIMLHLRRKKKDPRGWSIVFEGENVERKKQEIKKTTKAEITLISAFVIFYK